jgi:hypothetical protein
MKRAIVILAALALLFGGGGESLAGFIIESGRTQQTGSGSGGLTYEYSFDVQLTAGSTLQKGGFFTIYDLPALPAGALSSEPNIFWSSSEQKQGITPSGISVVIPDDPNIENVTWQWNGAGPITAPGTGNMDLGRFVVGPTTQLASPPVANLTWLGTLDGGASISEGTVSINAPVTVPEPASLTLLGLGSLGLLGFGWRRRNRAAA